jgi:hypothetical protein
MIAPTRRPGPMPFTVLMDQAMREARRHWRAILPSVALPVAVLAAAVPLIQARYMEAIGGAEADPFQAILPGCGFMLAMFGLLTLMGLAFTTMQVATMDAVTGREVDMKRSWRFTATPRVLGTLLLVGLAVVVLLIAGLVPVAVIAGLGAAVNPALAVLVGIVGGLFLLVAVFLSSSFLSFVTPVMAEEGAFGASALRRSMSLVLYSPSGRLFSARPMWKVLGFLVVGLVISWMVSLLVSLPFALPVWIDAFRKAAAGQEPDPSAYLWLQVIGQLVGAAASSAVYLYVSFGVSLLFFDSRGRKEGADLADAIDAMAVPPVPPPVSPGFPA